MISRRTTIKLLAAAGATAALPPAFATPSAGHVNTVSAPPLSRLLFGSCAHQDKDQPIWTPINAMDPELFVFLGDNIYGDTRDMKILAQKYKKLAAKPGFQTLRKKTPVIAIWDDHDFGENDAGREYPEKEGSKDLFFKFWDEAKDSPRRRDAGGIYTAYEYGPMSERVQVILPDLRWDRTPIVRANDVDNKRRSELGFGPYIPSTDTKAKMLDEAQWLWLEDQLRRPAKLRIIGSSVQFLSSFPGWEGWGLFPNERQRMIDLITKTRAEGVLFISGDTHWAELSRQSRGVPYPLYDFTSSGLTQTWHNVSPNAHRLPNCLYTEENFGVVEINWQVPDPMIVLQARDISGKPVFERSILLSELSF